MLAYLSSSVTLRSGVGLVVRQWLCAVQLLSGWASIRVTLGWLRTGDVSTTELGRMHSCVSTVGAHYMYIRMRLLSMDIVAYAFVRATVAGSIPPGVGPCWTRRASCALCTVRANDNIAITATFARAVGRNTQSMPGDAARLPRVRNPKLYLQATDATRTFRRGN